MDIYYSEDSQAIARLMNVQEDGMGVFPVLIQPALRRRIVATDEIIVQVKQSIGAPQAIALFNQEGLEILDNPVPSARGQFLVRMASVSHRLQAGEAESGRATKTRVLGAVCFHFPRSWRAPQIELLSLCCTTLTGSPPAGNDGDSFPNRLHAAKPSRQSLTRGAAPRSDAMPRRARPGRGRR